MKTAGSSVEFALALSCSSTDLVTGGTHDEVKEGFVHQNNLYYDKEKDKYFKRFHQHTTPQSLEQRLKPELFKKYTEYDWITMVRNPWDSLVSYYWWNDSDSEYLCKNKDERINVSDPRKTVQKKFNNFIFSVICEFSKNGKTSPTKPGALETMTCFEYLKKYNTQFIDPRIDHYIRYEHLEQDFEHVVDTLGLYNVELPHFKSTQKKLKKHYSYYYTTETRKIVAEGFKDYIEKFDYKFENKITKLSRRDRAKRRKDKKR
jgi:hypothetical protein